MATKKAIRGASSQAKSAKKKVAFSLAAAKANDVRLVGDFNDWDQSADPMTREKKGLWKTALDLSPGTYEYKYLVDGNWWTDPAKERIWNPFGSENSVITV